MALNWTRLRVVPAQGLRVRCERGWRLDRRWSDRLNDYDLFVIWAGRGRVRLRDRIIDLLPGVCLWMRPGGLYLADHDPADRLGVTAQHFELIDRRTGRRPAPDKLPGEVHHLLDVAYADAVLRRVRTLADQAAGGVLLQGLLMDVVASGQTPLTGTKRAHHEVVTAAAAAIADAPDRAWSVRRLADEAGYSTDHFTRVFREQLGQTPRDYQVAVRIERARQLLRSSSMNVSQIAAALGYRDVAFFSRQFKARTGVSPIAYRDDR